MRGTQENSRRSICTCQRPHGGDRTSARLRAYARRVPFPAPARGLRCDARQQPPHARVCLSTVLARAQSPPRGRLRVLMQLLARVRTCMCVRARVASGTGYACAGACARAGACAGACGCAGAGAGVGAGVGVGAGACACAGARAGSCAGAVAGAGAGAVAAL